MLIVNNKMIDDNVDPYKTYIYKRAEQDLFVESAMKLINACKPLVDTFKSNANTNFIDMDSCLALVKAYDAIVPSEENLTT